MDSWGIGINELLTLAAMIIGPIAAVQITRMPDDRKESRDRKLRIYKTLMATRAAGLSGAHIEALNSIDMEFSSSRKGDKKVRLTWKAYLDHLSDKSMAAEQWSIRRVDLFVDMLGVMGEQLGYDFDNAHIKNGVYSPMAHGELESDQTEIRRSLPPFSTPRCLSVAGSGFCCR